MAASRQRPDRPGSPDLGEHDTAMILLRHPLGPAVLHHQLPQGHLRLRPADRGGWASLGMIQGRATAAPPASSAGTASRTEAQGPDPPLLYRALPRGLCPRARRLHRSTGAEPSLRSGVRGRQARAAAGERGLQVDRERQNRAGSGVGPGRFGHVPLTHQDDLTPAPSRLRISQGVDPRMEIYRGGGLPQTVLDWTAPAARSLTELKLADLDPVLLVLGLALALATWRTQRSWLRGLLGEWRVARLLRRHGAEARHDVLLPHPDGAGWTQIDHLVRLPDRILVIETRKSRRQAPWRRARPALDPALRLALIPGPEPPAPERAPPRRRARRRRPRRPPAGYRAAGRPGLGRRAPAHGLLPPGRLLPAPARGPAPRPLQPIGHDRLDTSWARLADAASNRLIDRWRHAAAIDLRTGAKPRVAGAGLALAAGAALGFALAG